MVINFSHFTFKKTSIKMYKTLLDKNQLDQLAEWHILQRKSTLNAGRCGNLFVKSNSCFLQLSKLLAKFVLKISAFCYAALLPRRGPHIASHSVCMSVCLSVCPSVCPSVPLLDVEPSYKIEKLRFSSYRASRRAT